MKIRNPFKDNWGRWKDDISIKEKFIWNLVSVMVGMAFGLALANFIFQRNEKTNSTITIEMKIGILILSFVFTLGIMYGAINMFIKFGLFRNPFKDKWGRWKDDVSRKEQIIWNFFIIMGGLILVNILREFISNNI